MDWASHLRRIIAHPSQGDDATFTHGTAQASSVKGRFAAPYIALPAGIDSGFSSNEPRFAAMTGDVPAVEEGDALTLLPIIDGTTGTVNYTIVGIEKDELGGYSVLQLRKTA